MKITHISKDKLIKIRYESDSEKVLILKAMRSAAEYFDVEVEELK